MQRVAGVDSVVLQVTGDGDLIMAKKIEVVLGGQLEILKCSPIRPTKEGAKSWRGATGRAIPKSAAFIALVHHARGQSIPMVRYGNGKGVEVGFHGLQQFDRDQYALSDGSLQRMEILKEFLSLWSEPITLTRFDRSFDLIGKQWSGYTNTRLHRNLSKRHGAAVYRGTTIYYKGKKPKYAQVVAYDKQTANGLNYPLTRIEYSFKGQYWRTGEMMKADELIESAIIRTDGYIKRASH